MGRYQTSKKISRDDWLENQYVALSEYSFYKHLQNTASYVRIRRRMIRCIFSSASISILVVLLVFLFRRFLPILYVVILLFYILMRRKMRNLSEKAKPLFFSNGFFLGILLQNLTHRRRKSVITPSRACKKKGATTNRDTTSLSSQ